MGGWFYAEASPKSWFILGLAGVCRLPWSSGGNLRMAKRLVTILVLAHACVVFADEEASNISHVTASQHGQCYAKSIPAELHGQRGVTRIYKVAADKDVLLHALEWFSQRVYLECNVSPSSGPVGVSVVRLGPWARGHQANDNELGIAFYFKGALVKRYSTLDLAGAPDNVSRSVSHYTVIDSVDGYRWSGTGNRYEFVVRMTDARALRFDPTTGEFTEQN